VTKKVAGIAGMVSKEKSTIKLKDLVFVLRIANKKYENLKSKN